MSMNEDFGRPCRIGVRVLAARGESVLLAIRGDKGNGQQGQAF